LPPLHGKFIYVIVDEMLSKLALPYISDGSAAAVTGAPVLLSPRLTANTFLSTQVMTPSP